MGWVDVWKGVDKMIKFIGNLLGGIFFIISYLFFLCIYYMWDAIKVFIGFILIALILEWIGVINNF